MDFKEKDIERDSQKIILRIWDTTGQERFRSLTLGFLRNMDGILLCYDITDRMTFERIDEWFQSIKQHTNRINVVLVGNKSDLCEKKNC